MFNSTFKIQHLRLGPWAINDIQKIIRQPNNKEIRVMEFRRMIELSPLTNLTKTARQHKPAAADGKGNVSRPQGGVASLSAGLKSGGIGMTSILVMPYRGTQ
ncbi:hypothetical protein SAMN05444359_112104 [Neolewinella agarilytica]|uniref:Uncharacterized protein n=1 Tax=Neolewinella agarilytica TaxID=478744 RepID=A0A1H9HCD5_9BACT|nr:hypothetical protein SAMN05444359_112104 [Neolewinella agarilytica]